MRTEAFSEGFLSSRCRFLKQVKWIILSKCPFLSKSSLLPQAFTSIAPSLWHSSNSACLLPKNVSGVEAGCWHCYDVEVAVLCPKMHSTQLVLVFYCRISYFAVRQYLHQVPSDSRWSRHSKSPGCKSADRRAEHQSEMRWLLRAPRSDTRRKAHSENWFFQRSWVQMS